MQAVTLSSSHLTFQRDFPAPVPKQGEALIKVLVAGICSTDLEIVKGYADFQGILGHEFVGLVENAPDSAWLGKKVVGSINIGCRSCGVCLGHGPEHCPSRTVLGIHGHDGAFAEYLTLPISNLVEVPSSVSDEQAVFTEPLAAALRIREQIAISPSQRIAVVGPGKLGMLIAQVLAIGGTDLTVIGRSEASLEMAESLRMKTGLVEKVPDEYFDLVVEVTGNQQGLAQALRLVRPQGVLILKSTFSGKSRIDLTKIVVAEINVIGSRCGPFAPALRLLREKSIVPEKMIEASYPLSDWEAAFAHASQPGVRKILVYP